MVLWRVRWQTFMPSFAWRSTTDAFVARVRSNTGGQSAGALRQRPQREAIDIAVVGMSCLLPGATNLEDFWRNIVERRDLITEVPRERFEAERWFDPNRKAPDKIYSKWGGFLSAIPFDPFKFGIPPNALRSIEPGQLLTLEVVDRALRDAGYGDYNPHREETSVMFGVSGGWGTWGRSMWFARCCRSCLPSPIKLSGRFCRPGPKTALRGCCRT